MIENRASQNLAIRERLWRDFPLQSKQRLLVYVSVRDEVETNAILDDALRQLGEVVVPYCLPGHQLGLFALRETDELRTGVYGIKEPAIELRKARSVEPQSLSQAILPGVAFDICGNRLGYGKGYFDRFLSRLKPDCLRIGLAFECQIVSEIPNEPHDLSVQRIVTPLRTIPCEQSA